jgi:hypothetical protein
VNGPTGEPRPRIEEGKHTMKRISFRHLACTGLLLFAVSGMSAQDRDRYRDEDRYHQGMRNDAWWGNRMFDRIRDDVDHVTANSPYFSGDRFRLARVKQELNELQGKYTSRGYDAHEINDVIVALQRVSRDNRLAPRDRDMLNADIGRLRRFQEHHDGYR